MSTLRDLVEEHTRMRPADIEHLHRLAGEWQLLSDLSFADLVLWVPVEGERVIPVGERRLGQALLYELAPEDEAVLRADWEELAGYIGRGHVEQLTGHLGTFLQIRPKAAHSRARRVGIDADGAPFAALPKGFYLRPSFTRALLARHFALPTRNGGNVTSDWGVAVSLGDLWVVAGK